MAGRLNLVVFWAVITTREGTKRADSVKGPQQLGQSHYPWCCLSISALFFHFLPFFNAFGVVGACGTEPPLPVCSPVSAVSTLTILWSPRSLERDLERARADHISEMENLTEKHRQQVSETKKKQWVSWNFSAQLYTSCNILLSSLMTDNRSSFPTSSAIFNI